MDVFSLKETPFFALSPVPPFIAQLNNLVAHPVGSVLSKSPFSKISADTGTFSNFIAEISKGRRPYFCTFTLILF